MLVSTYTVILYQKIGGPKSKVRQQLANHKVWTFSNWQNRHLSAKKKKKILGFPTVILQSSAFLINWSWNQAKSTSYCPLYIHSAPRWKTTAFPKTIAATGQAISFTNHTKSHRWRLVKVPTGGNEPYRLLKYSALLIFCGRTGALAFHLCGR